MSPRVAAFFDLDGTLLPLPSMEQRLFRMLRHRREIPFMNYLLWLQEALKVLPRGIRAVTHANKMYLRGVQSFDESGAWKERDSRAHVSGHTGEGRPSMPPKHNPRWPVPLFLKRGWNALPGMQGKGTPS